jgi:hypothetical protein
MQETHWGIWTLRQDKGVVPWLTKGSRQEKGSGNMKSGNKKIPMQKYPMYKLKNYCFSSFHLTLIFNFFYGFPWVNMLFLIHYKSQ